MFPNLLDFNVNGFLKTDKIILLLENKIPFFYFEEFQALLNYFPDYLEDFRFLEIFFREVYEQEVIIAATQRSTTSFPTIISINSSTSSWRYFLLLGNENNYF